MTESDNLRLQRHDLLTDIYTGTRSHKGKPSLISLVWSNSNRPDNAIGGWGPSSEVGIRFNPERVLAPDSISDAFGRMAVFSIDGYDGGMYPFIDQTEARLLDVGGGSGIFGVSVADSIRGNHKIKLDVVDNSDVAIQTAQLNIDEAVNRSAAQITDNYINSDWLANVPVPPDGEKYNVIYFNPPYLEEGHKISNALAAQAPGSALYANSAWDEYEKVLPELPKYLDQEGMAMVRLPIEPSEEMFGKLGEFVNSLEETFDWTFVNITAGNKDRKGFGLVISNEGLPGAFGEYDYYCNYLDGKYKSYAPKTDTLPLFSDKFCKFDLIKKKTIAPRLGISI